VETILDTTMQAQVLDPQAAVVTSITSGGFERDSFRGNWFVVTDSMLDPASSQSMAGVYITHVPPPGVN
jgi:hypothetical protein